MGRKVDAGNLDGYHIMVSNTADKCGCTGHVNAWGRGECDATNRKTSIIELVMQRMYSADSKIEGV